MNLQSWLGKKASRLKKAQGRIRGKVLRKIAAGQYSDQHICHFSFHKNLTVYYANVAREFAVETGRRQKHFNSFKDEFLSAHNLDMRSVNNHFVNVRELRQANEGLRASLFVRDPRDLVVSGYHYHKRGAESWCNVKRPSADTLRTVNLDLPAGYLQGDESISECLSRLDEETGIQVEIEMRAPHFKALQQWLEYVRQDDEMIVLTYDEMFSDNVAGMAKLADHYRLTGLERDIWIGKAGKYARQNVKGSHVRDPSPSQGSRKLARSHNDFLADRYPELIAYFAAA